MNFETIKSRHEETDALFGRSGAATAMMGSNAIWEETHQDRGKLIRMVEEREDAYGVLEAKADFDAHLLEKAQAQIAKLQSQIKKAYVQGWTDGNINKGWMSEELDERIAAIKGEDS